MEKNLLPYREKSLVEKKSRSPQTNIVSAINGPDILAIEKLMERDPKSELNYSKSKLYLLLGLRVECSSKLWYFPCQRLMLGNEPRCFGYTVN